MDWLKELLKKLGVEESKLNGAVSDIGKELPKHFVPKNQYNDLSETKKKLEQDISDRDKQIEDIKKSAGNNEELKKQIETLQGENKTAKEKYESESKELKTNIALKLKLAGKVHENALENVITEFDKSKLVLDEHGNIKEGFEDQEKSLRESKGFYFIPEKDESQTFKGLKLFEGKGNDEGGGGNNSNNIGKQLAAMNKQSGDGSAKAQANYFGGAKNE